MDKKYLIKCSTEIKDMWEQGLIKCPIHLCGGNEEQLINIFDNIKYSDYVISTHRNMYHYLLKGGNFDVYKQKILSRDNAGSMALNEPTINFYSTGIVGGGCAVACGIAVALKRKNSTSRVICFVGDGATDTGHFHEAIRYSISFDLPILFIVENNDRSVESTNNDRWGTGGNSHFYYGDKLICYDYVPTYPHVGSGKFVHF